MEQHLQAQFLAKYGRENTETYFTPGRVNLIGEHIDYNGGLVMPAAITMGTWVLLAPNNENRVRFSSVNFPEEGTFDLGETLSKTGKEWFNYPLGVFHEMLADGRKPGGLDLLFFGNVPIGSGLSSSASIEVATAYALNEHFDLGYTRLELVQLAQRVENKFIGVNCGIMDQFAVAFGQRDKAILLDCDTLKHKMVDCNIGDHVLAIINTNKPRELAESKYNERVEECQAAVKALQQEISIQNLCELTAEKFALHSHLITDETVLKRATHVVRENDRVHLAARALNEGDLPTFGRLMYASHESLKELYEVSGAELDAIVSFCSTYPGVTGARMTGAGFGGCAIALLQKGQEDDFTEKLTAAYTENIGYKPAVYISEIGEGSHELVAVNA
ncbi:galactokinase [Pedobacter yulinensis]|uniref:Galactokinase n=1 Tax=Pedobacter yulinensis TaxID=2126353 RepID=A0A2T3HKQ2_9SPHI|nr:galactokinase [Pedobacter yulinensis]PST83035.1 galactokinase [Pedobacter yulinensis]